MNPGRSLRGDWPHPRWFAHRGAGRLAPENTLAAFRVGAGHGYRAFECDVKLSADGVPFLLHDAELDRTTDATGLATRLPWSELSRLDAGGWHGPEYAGDSVGPAFDPEAMLAARHGGASVEELTGRAWSLRAGLPDPMTVLIGGH